MYTYDDFLKKHEPHYFKQLVFPDDLVQDELKAYAERENFDNILLYGPIGSAKSTAARVISEESQRAAGVTNIMVSCYEAKHLKSKTQQILNSISLVMSMQQELDLQPYVIIEEVDQLNSTEQLELRAELNTRVMGKLIMTTNNLMNIDRALQSRCDCIEVVVPTTEQFLMQAHAILAVDGVKDTDANLLQLMQTASLTSNVADMRDIMRALHKRVVRLQRSLLPAQQAAPITPPPVKKRKA